MECEINSGKIKLCKNPSELFSKNDSKIEPVNMVHILRRNFKMKQTAPNLANFYDVHFNTVHNWKKKKPALYKAMVDYFMKSGDNKYE